MSKVDCLSTPHCRLRADGPTQNTKLYTDALIIDSSIPPQWGDTKILAPPRFQNPGGKTCPPDFEPLGGEYPPTVGGYGNLAEQKRWGDTKEAGGILKNEGYPPKYPPTVGGYRLQTWGDT